ncbi:hypothetical protein [Hymenobacter volaticus]|nr:hypothetical protein [Hymenobacter volaticus]
MPVGNNPARHARYVAPQCFAPEQAAQQFAELQGSAYRCCWAVTAA